MLDSKGISRCHEIRIYGRLIARFDKQEDEVVYDQRKSIIVYEYDNEIYYIVMVKGEYIDLLKGGIIYDF